MKEREQPSLAGSPVSDECTYPGKVPLAAKNLPKRVNRVVEVPIAKSSLVCDTVEMLGAVATTPLSTALCSTAA
ncbi:hypothetical protein OKW30_002449 [Paraburkholderia sp. Clong3]|nr:hypothetical protein [Paraburkholderia sp. CI2]